MQRYALAKYTLIEAWKRRLIYLYTAAMLLCLLLATYGASLVMTDKAAVLAMFYGFLVRLLLALMTAGYVILTEMQHIIPPSRVRYLAQKALAYGALVAALVLISALPLLPMHIGGSVMASWIATLLFELMIVVALALMLCVLCRQPLTALSLFVAIYLFARSSGSLFRQSGDLLTDAAGWYERGPALIVHLATWLVPRLEQFASAEWLLHPNSAAPDWTTLVLQTLLYIAVLLLIALERLQRRTF